MAKEQIQEAIVLLRKAMEAVEACLDEYGGSEEVEEESEYGETEDSKMNKMMSILGPRKK